MPTQPVYLALSLIVPVAFATGMLVARAVCRRRYRAEQLQREVHMTARLEERYAAYVELEGQVQRIFRRLDELEAETASSLEATGVHIRELDELMSACEGKPVAARSEQAPQQPAEQTTERAATQPAASEGDALGWMDSLDEVLEVYCEDDQLPGEQQQPEAGEPAELAEDGAELEDTEPATHATAEAIAEWERKLETLRAEKRVEIERQGRVIAELTERLQRLQAQASAPRQAVDVPATERAATAQAVDESNATDRTAAEPTTSQARPAGAGEAVLAKELELWQRKHHALERERTHEEAEVLALREEAAHLAALVSELEPLRAVQVELSQRVQALELELCERDEELSRARGEAAMRNEELEGTRAELAARQKQLEAARKEIHSGEERAAQLERRHAEAEAERRVEIEALECRIDELEPLLDTVAQLREQIEACEQREADQRERAGELEADGRRLRGEIEALRGERKAATEMLSASKRALEEADERQHELEQRITSLSARNETLSRELGETRRSAEGQTTRISSLMSQLDEVQSTTEDLRREAELRGSMVEAAEGLLAELKPKLEALEARLHRRSDG